MSKVKLTAEELAKLQNAANQALEKEKAWITYARIKKFIRDTEPLKIKTQMLNVILEHLPTSEESTDQKITHVQNYQYLSELMDDFMNIKNNNLAEMKAYAEAYGDWPC